MQPYVTTVIVDEKRRIMLDLPDDMPTGPIEITARPLAASEPPPEPLTREWVREKLKAAGLLDDKAEPDAMAISDQEMARLGQVFADVRSISELIDEDREERL
ncbi:MAG: hypothetical protein HZC41_03570 [Chloroflexi bacterium]|nr:hypothetical protein [Chloroflexota bacterium]